MIAHPAANAALEDYCWQLSTLIGSLDARWRQQAREAGDVDQIGGASSAFVSAHREPLRASLDPLFARMSALLDELSPEARRPAEELYRQLVQPYFLQSPFARRALDKPLGYAGDYRLVETIFRGMEGAPTPLGKLLGDYALRSGPSEAHRGRMPWAMAQLDALVARVGRPRVLSFACGPEVILRRWVAQGGVGDLFLADHDPTALSWARRNLEKARPPGNDSTLTTVVANAYDFKPGCDPARRLELTEPVDAVMVLGLLDYLDDDATVSLLSMLREVLRPGGVLLLSNLHAPNPWRALMELTADWNVIHRTVPEFEGLVRAVGGFDPPSTTLHVSGTNLYCAARRSLDL